MINNLSEIKEGSSVCRVLAKYLIRRKLRWFREKILSNLDRFQRKNPNFVLCSGSFQVSLMMNIIHWMMNGNIWEQILFSNNSRMYWTVSDVNAWHLFCYYPSNIRCILLFIRIFTNEPINLLWVNQS